MSAGRVSPRLIEELADDLAAIAADLLHCLADALRAHRVHRLEAEVLELHAHAVHAQAIGDGGVDFQGFLGDAPAFLARQHFQGAHVVQAVGQLDQDHADVARHGHRHLLEVLRLRLVAGAEDRRQLGDAVDDFCNFATETSAERFFVDTRVFHHVVQERRHQRLMVHSHLGEDFRDRERMRDVGMSGAPVLTAMRLRGEIVGAANAVDLRRRQIGRERFREFFDRDGCCDRVTGSLFR